MPCHRASSFFISYLFRQLLHVQPLYQVCSSGTRRFLCQISCKGRLAREKFLQVQPNYGTLLLKGNINFIVKPDLEHLCGTLCRLRLFAEDEEFDVEVIQNSEKNRVCVSGHFTKDSIELPCCELVLPVKYNLVVELTGRGSVHVKQLQNESTVVSTEQGRLEVDSLQCLLLTYSTLTGDMLIWHKLLASLSVKAKTLSIRGRALQSGSVTLRAEELFVDLESLHAETVSIKSGCCRLSIRNLTSSSHVQAPCARIAIGNCSGVLHWEMEKGDVRTGVVQLERDSSMELKYGRCVIAVPDDKRFSVSAAAPDVSVSEHLQRAFADKLFLNHCISALESSVPCKLSAGEGKPLLKINVNEGSLEILEWKWPLTPGLL